MSKPTYRVIGKITAGQTVAVDRERRRVWAHEFPASLGLHTATATEDLQHRDTAAYYPLARTVRRHPTP